MLGLAVLLPPHHDESLVGYLYRLAHLNAVTGAELLKAFKNAKSDDVKRWTSGPVIPAGWSDLVLELRQPGTRPTKPWNHRSRKFCPHCLSERSYWRATWNLTLVTCCTRHRIALHDCCNACGAKLSAEAMRCMGCTQCGQPLASASATVSVTGSGTLWIARQLVRRMSGRSVATRHATSHLALADFHELVMRIGIRALLSDRRKPMKLRDAGALAVVEPIAETAGRVLMEWPRGFVRLLDKIRLQRTQGAGWKINQTMGPIYHDIYRYLNDARFDFVRVAFETYLRTRWDGPLALRNRNLSTEFVEQHRWVPLHDAARAIDVDQALLNRLVVNEKIPSREYVHGSGRVARVVDLDAVRALAGRLQGALTLEQAAKELALGKDRVRQLLEAGLLSAMGGRPTIGERWWIDPVSPEQWATCEIHTGIRSSQTVSVAHLAKFCLSTSREFISLLQAIRSGRLRLVGYSGKKRQIGGWLLDEVEVNEWRAATRSVATSKISITAAAARLGVKQEVAYALIRAGLLSTIVEASGRRCAHWVTTKALRQFQTRYVLGPELRVALGTSAKALPQKLHAAGFVAVAGPKIGHSPCRQYVWRRTRKLLTFVARQGKTTVFKHEV